MSPIADGAKVRHFGLPNSELGEAKGVPAQPLSNAPSLIKYSGGVYGSRRASVCTPSSKKRSAMSILISSPWICSRFYCPVRVLLRLLFLQDASKRLAVSVS